MKIGIDLGGSHIGFGVIENETILEKYEKDFTDEDKSHIIEVIEEYIVGKVKELEEKYDNIYKKVINIEINLEKNK